MASKKRECGTQMLFFFLLGTAAVVFSVIIFIVVDECQRFGYSIPQFSHPSWRKHVEQGWLATEIIMCIDYLFVFVTSLLLAASIFWHKGYYQAVQICRVWVFLMILTLILELGCGLYQYSWYAMIIFRRGVVGFYCLYWFLRICFFVFGVVCGMGRLRELRMEKRYGIKPTLLGSSGVPKGYLPPLEVEGRLVGAGSKDDLELGDLHTQYYGDGGYPEDGDDGYRDEDASMDDSDERERLNGSYRPEAPPRRNYSDYKGEQEPYA